MRLYAKRPSSVYVTKLNVLSFLTPVHMKEKHLNMFYAKRVKKWVQAKCLEMCLNSKHNFYNVE